MLKILRQVIKPFHVYCLPYKSVVYESFLNNINKYEFTLIELLVHKRQHFYAFFIFHSANEASVLRTSTEAEAGNNFELVANPFVPRNCLRSSPRQKSDSSSSCAKVGLDE